MILVIEFKAMAMRMLKELNENLNNIKKNIKTI